MKRVALRCRPLPDLTPEPIIEHLRTDYTVAAIFDSEETMEGFLREVRAADWALSVNVAGLTGPVHACAKRAGIIRHTVEYSLGFQGALDLLPERQVLNPARANRILSSVCPLEGG